MKESMKTIFTCKGRQYSYKIVDGTVKTYEMIGTHDNEIDVECEKLTDEDWEYIFQNYDKID